MSLGALAFLNPWLLAALATLPLIYWLLRTVPPRPKQVAFPPTRILVGIENRDKEPAKTPWWLMLIRLVAAALVIFALAEPVLNPERERALAGTGPVALVVDNGWTAASRWSERRLMMERVVAHAEAEGRPVVVIATAPAARTVSARLEAPSAARNSAAAIEPQPFAPDRAAALSSLRAALGSGNGGAASVVWLADGVDHAGEATAFANDLAAIAAAGSLSVVTDPASAMPIGLEASVGAGGRLEARILSTGSAARSGMVHALSARGDRLGEAPFELAAGAASAEITLGMPLELRNQVTRLEIAGERAAGAVSLVDARSKWQRVAVLSGESQEQAQPLLAPLYYIERALQPYSELVRPKDQNLADGVAAALAESATVLVLADIGTLSGEVRERVQSWVEKGGVLVRFAGPRLEKGGDDLLPVPLRLGGRTLGGALSWSTPQPLAAFEDSSLFAGLAVPEDVRVNRQVLADPARLDAEVAVWARLKDGTPLVTARRKGDGQMVLFHVTANSDWSSLPLSGLFVDMLRRVATLGSSAPVRREGGGATAAIGTAAPNAIASVLTPLQSLDGYGTLKPPPPTAEAVTVADLARTVASLAHPPGYYGPEGSPRALNVLDDKSTLAPLPHLPAAAVMRGYESQPSTPLKSWLLAAALALLLVDVVAVISLSMGGLSLARLRPGARAAAIGLATIALATPSLLHAETAPAGSVKERPIDVATAEKATGKVTLGYVLTGNDAADQTSRIGLAGLCRVLEARTAVSPGEPLGVDIVNDEIAFYPVLYWPVLPEARDLPEATLTKIDAYMKQGGMIIFDTRDQGRGLPTGVAIGQSGTGALQRLLGRLDIPRLEPVPEGHVLTKSFYLLRTFPGRWDGGQMWVEADTGEGGAGDSRKARHTDGVTSILITSNDLAAAWALDERGRSLYPVVPGGEQQREMAFRTGINIVMHALTGNYKADQVHVPALLERLGQ
ncbi:MAG: DUF4159 domain-containing protein [Pseudomonadota bacterium]